MTEYDSAEVWDARVKNMQPVVDDTYEALVSNAIAVHLGDSSQHIVNAMYERLQALSPRDLAVVVVLALNERAVNRANALWSALSTMTPEDVR